MLGGYHNFMIPIGYGFSQSNLQKGLVLPKKTFKIFLRQTRVSTLKKIQLVFTMLILKNLKITNYALLVLTNWVLLIFLIN